MARRIARLATAAVVLALAGFGVWIFLRPLPRPSSPQPATSTAEHDSIIAALKAPKRERPVIAVIGINDATETTDYLMPYGILRRADIAEVMLLATGEGPVAMFPALTVEPHATTAAFDDRFPDGADYVIVPAMSRDDDPAALAWIRAQAARGATVIGVCAGAPVVAEAGLLNGRRATTHWYFLDGMLDAHPAIQYVRDRRIVVDDGVATTTGISASMPMALTPIEAIAGREKAGAVGASVGLVTWDVRHDSGAFALTRPFALTVLGNVLPFWNRERIAIELTDGMDEVSLALAADAWSRTYRSKSVTFSNDGAPIVTANGVRVIPEVTAADTKRATRLPSFALRAPADVLDDMLWAIGARYGEATADVVAMQLEYPRRN